MTMLANQKARAVADLTEGTILATVDIAVPPERVFRALASEEIATWWGADGIYRTTAWTGDVRVGGRWRGSGVGADGKPFCVEGEYLEIDAPRKLSHTWRPDWDAGQPTVVTYRLDAIEGGTRLTLRHTGFVSSESCAAHSDGWAMVLDWLKGFATPSAAPAEPRSYFLIRLNGPRPTFMLDMTDEERAIMGAHATYWRKLLAEGIAVAFGPVADPKGGWGVGIVEVDGPGALPALEANDPVTLSGRGFSYEILPMVQAVVRPPA